MTEESDEVPLIASGKVEFKDMRITGDVTRKKLSNRVWTRLVAKDLSFRNVNFSYCTFDACYLRNCVFDSCNFTGCRFVNSNLHGSSFSGCTFDYATFEKTDIDPSILDSEAPLRENLKMRFARSLRMNFQQLGDAGSVNRAITIELKAKSAHLYNASFSKVSYYRRKYRGWQRISHIGQLIGFSILDFVWGNGESAWKLFRLAVCVLLVIGLADGYFFHDSNSVRDYVDGVLKSPQIFMGTLSPLGYPFWYVSTILLVRLVFFGFFMATLVKRFNRR